MTDVLSGVNRTFVALESPTQGPNPAGFHPCQGLYWTPSRTAPQVAFVATHYNVDFSEHYLAPHLARLGYGFLGWNTRYRGVEGWFLLEHALVDIGAGVRWLREVAGADTVVLLGNSGGGSLMAAYQSQAVDPCIEAVAGMTLPDAVGELAPADLYVSLQAHVGRPEVLTAWFDPSVVDETDPLSRDPSVDMYDPDNGPPYSPEFVERYRQGQVARNDRITDWAVAELDRLARAGAWDRNFAVHRTWADLRFVDPALDPSDRVANTCYLGSPRWANGSPYGIAASCTLRTWLSMWSLRTSWCRGAPHLPRIAVPSLVVQSTGDAGVFPSDAHAIHDSLGASDKRLEMVAGDHYLQSPDGARTEVAQLIASWVAEHTS
jgi:hypothetical protein